MMGLCSRESDQLFFFALAARDGLSRFLVRRLQHMPSWASTWLVTRGLHDRSWVVSKRTHGTSPGRSFLGVIFRTPDGICGTDRPSWLPMRGDEQRRRDQLLLHEQLSEQNRGLREAHMKSLHEMEELKRVQGSRLMNFREED